MVYMIFYIMYEKNTKRSATRRTASPNIFHHRHRVTFCPLKNGIARSETDTFVKNSYPAGQAWDDMPGFCRPFYWLVFKGQSTPPELIATWGHPLHIRPPTLRAGLRGTGRQLLALPGAAPSAYGGQAPQLKEDAAASSKGVQSGQQFFSWRGKNQD